MPPPSGAAARRPMAEIIAEKRRQQAEANKAGAGSAAAEAARSAEADVVVASTRSAAEWEQLELRAFRESTATAGSNDTSSGRLVVVGFDELMTRGHISPEGRYPERPNRLSRTIDLLRAEGLLVDASSNVRRMFAASPAGSECVSGVMPPRRFASEAELAPILAMNEVGAAVRKFLFPPAVLPAPSAAVDDAAAAADSAVEQDANELAAARLTAAAAQHLPPSSLLATDLHVDATSAACARCAAAITIDAAVGVATGQFRHAFACVRPPGHHSGPPDCCHGFCLVNNVAAAAAALLLSAETERKKPVRRVAIVDIDVHAGDGTQSACDFINKALRERAASGEGSQEKEPSEVLFISLHRYDNGAFFPGTGHPHAAGPFGLNLNVGFNCSSSGAYPFHVMSDETLRIATTEFIVPLLRDAFVPDVVLVSCGFDMLEGDPLGGQAISVEGLGCFFETLARGLQRSTTEGGAAGVVGVMEGGYDVALVSSGVLSAVRGLARAEATPNAGGAAAAAPWQCKLPKVFTTGPKKLEAKLALEAKNRAADSAEAAQTATVPPPEIVMPDCSLDVLRRLNVDWTHQTLNATARAVLNASKFDPATHRVAAWLAEFLRVRGAQAK